MNRWITPATLPPGTFYCRRLLVPAAIDYLAAVKGALLPLTYAFNWEQVEGITPDEAAQAFLDLYDRLEFDVDRTCRMIGEIILWSTATSPLSDWLPCDGASYLRADYPDLFAVIGTLYGAVDGTHFNVPDLRGKVPIGQDGSTYTIANPVGEAAHTLTVAETPSHTHTDTGHTHTEVTAVPAVGAAITGVPVPSAVPGVGVTGVGSAALTSVGGDGSHNNIQPSMPLTFVIVAK